MEGEPRPDRLDQRRVVGDQGDVGQRLRCERRDGLVAAGGADERQAGERLHVGARDEDLMERTAWGMAP